MCGIFGIVGEYNETQARHALSKLSHRGPDYCGIVSQKNLFFAHQRLSIQDSHHRSHQPFKHEKILLSFNGEIYNFKALRQELDFKFQTDSDTEVIIAAYLKWGVGFVNHLRGMFAIALLDGDTLYLFRDRLGKKPLYFLQQDSFYFASEIKALTPFLSKKEMSEDALMSYLTFLAPTPPHTFYKGIYKLAAGEYLTFTNGKTKVTQYWDALNAPSNIITSEEEALQKVESLLEESITLRLDTQAPTATLLSGGIDSATINYYAKQRNYSLPTYTLGYEEFSKYDERKNATHTAQALGLRNTAVVVNEQSFIETSEKVLTQLDEPLNDPAAVPLYYLFEQIQKDGHKVVISGEGSDEIFLGYRQYFEYLDIEQAASLSHKNWLKKYFRSNFSMNREWEWYKRVFDDTLLFRSSGEKFTDLQKNNLLRRNVRDNESLKYIQSYKNRFDASKHSDNSLWYSYIDLNLFQAEHFLTKLDRVSMAHSIESRTPFLDHKLVETLFSLEPSLRYRDGVTKSLLKKIMRNRLPQETLLRKKKGFANPYMEYLINSGKIELITQVNQESGMFHPKELNEYIQNARSGSFKQHVWGLYVLSQWMQREML